VLTERGAEVATAAGADVVTERLNAGRRRLREDREKREALNAGAQTAA
jgi:hypothetical protein